MPVTTGSGEGSTRHYKGKPQPLGIMPQWDCVNCGHKVEAADHPPEQGCPHCGAGVPGQAGIQPPPKPAVDPAAPQQPIAPPRTGERPASVINAGQPVESLDSRVATVYRLLKYTGSKAWLETTLRRSLVGRMELGAGQLLGTIVDDVSPRQQDLLNMAARQPGVWLGNSTSATAPADWKVTPLSRDMPLVAVTSPVTSFTETRPMADTAPPPTGPTFTPEQEMTAKRLHALVGNQGSYTIAMALNQFATVVEDETMEPDKYWSPQECLAIANALLQLVPESWQQGELQGEVADAPADAG